VAVGALLLGAYGSLARPVVVALVPRAHLAEANGRMGAGRGVADVAGSGLAGVLLAVLAAPLVVLVDAASFVASALLLTLVRERPAAPPQRPPRATGDGGLHRLGGALLRGSGVQVLLVMAFAHGVLEPVTVLYLVRGLRLPAGGIGLLLGLGAVGGVTGGLVVARVLRRWGPGPAFVAGALIVAGSLLVLPVAVPGPSAVASVLILELAGNLGAALLVAVAYGQLQGTAAEGTVARVTALFGTLVQAAAVAGVLLGGLLGTLVGLRATTAVAAGLLLVAVLAQVPRWRRAGWRVERVVGAAG
jgi:predicted MFS family arabinose efflux permease